MTAMQVEMSDFAARITSNKYSHTLPSGHKESWPQIATRVVSEVVGPYLPSLVGPITQLVTQRKLLPGGRYLYAAGRRYPQCNNCFLFRVHDSREGWGKLLDNSANALMTGGGVGVVYSDLREENAPIKGMGGKSSGPCSLMQIVNEAGRHMRQGGSRRSALWAGLHWDHPDIFKFIHLKDWIPEVQALKRKDFNFPATMDGTNISVILNTEFFTAYADHSHPKHRLAHQVYDDVIYSMLKTGEPGFSVDIGDNEGENLRNACTEVTSRDNEDMCNLASLNLARFNTMEEFMEALPLGVAFLMCGTQYSVLPIPSMYAVREKNRRIGLGLMGVHEWLLKRGYRYGPTEELQKWMEVYQTSGKIAKGLADLMSISCPVATRSIAPTGTISIVAETTGGADPLFASAYKRRYLDGEQWKYQYVVDATARRLVEQGGIDPDLIEDAYTLAEDVERRVGFQGWLQRYVDHGVSSTINLPPWGSSINNESTVSSFGRSLFSYLPELRGITAYPDGARGGQPLTRMPYREAIRLIGKEYVEVKETGDESCAGGFCNS